MSEKITATIITIHLQHDEMDGVAMVDVTCPEEPLLTSLELTYEFAMDLLPGDVVQLSGETVERRLRELAGE